MPKFLLPLFLIGCAAFWVALKFSGNPDAQTSVTLAESEIHSGSFRPEAPGPRAAVLKRRTDNHFWADAKINKTRVEFMVDTGATSVALTREDARRIGFKEDELDYKWDISTAGGNTRGAYVLIEEIQIGSVKVKDVPALVVESDLKQSLLGMSFMNELSSYEVRKSSMIIRE